MRNLCISHVTGKKVVFVMLLRYVYQQLHNYITYIWFYSSINDAF